jgi:alkylation response protein AidB-like acyl-CoA dehydrogenase
MSTAPQAHIVSFSDPRVASYRLAARNWIASALPREWAEDHDPPSFEEDIRRRREWDRLKARDGWAGIPWPRAYGGRGEGPVEEYVFYEEATRAHAPNTANAIGLDLAGPALMEFGTDEQRARFLPRIINAEDLWCEGFSEPNAGSDLAALSTRAEKVSGGWQIEGQKIWTSRAQFADRIFLAARTCDGPRHRNISVLLVDMHQPGISVRPIEQISEGPEFNFVFFDGAFVADDCLLGEENKGWNIIGLSGFRQGRRIFDAVRWYVIIGETLDKLAACVAHQGGRQHRRLVELQSRAAALRWHMMRTTEMMAQDAGWLKPVQVLRLEWSELWQEVAECGIAIGCRQCEPYWRFRYIDTRSVTIHGGTAQIQRNVIADRVLELPR